MASLFESQIEIDDALVARVQEQLIADVNTRRWAEMYHPMPAHKTWEEIAREAIRIALGQETGT